jgi:hypothetical protein
LIYFDSKRRFIDARMEDFIVKRIVPQMANVQ